MRQQRLLVFTDVDGTLIDHYTYRWDAAVPAIERLKRQGVPIIFCTSKTRPEVERLYRLMGLHGPFIAETGGGVFLPAGEFDTTGYNTRRVNHWEAIDLGYPYSQLRNFLIQWREQEGVSLRGFGDMDTHEIARLTGLPPEEAALAHQRDYDEPFLVEGEPPPDWLDHLKAAAEKGGMGVFKGTRFYHLVGPNDKGKAVRLVTELYRRKWGEAPRTIGLGDSPSDLPMFEAVDVPVLVQRPNGTYSEDILRHGRPLLAEGIGPKGWNQAILKILENQST